MLRLLSRASKKGIGSSTIVSVLKEFLETELVIARASIHGARARAHSAGLSDQPTIVGGKTELTLTSDLVASFEH